MKILAVLSIMLCFLQISKAQCDFDPTVTGEFILCPNSSTTLSTQLYDSYQWYRRGFNDTVASPIEGDTLQSILVDNSDVLFYFSVEATLDGCTELSPEILLDGWAFLPVTVQSTGDFTIGNNGESIVCIGDTMYFLLNLPYDTNITWFRNGNPMGGATTTILPVTTEGLYTVTAAPSVCPDYIQSLGLTLEVQFIDCSTGIEVDLTSENEILIFPNPTSDQLNIKNESHIIYDMNIYNNLGQLVSHEKEIGEFTRIDVSSFSKGIYFLEINKKAGKELHKFIVH